MESQAACGRGASVREGHRVALHRSTGRGVVVSRLRRTSCAGSSARGQAAMVAPQALPAGAGLPGRVPGPRRWRGSAMPGSAAQRPPDPPCAQWKGRRGRRPRGRVREAVAASARCSVGAGESGLSRPRVAVRIGAWLAAGRSGAWSRADATSRDEGAILRSADGRCLGGPSGRVLPMPWGAGRRSFVGASKGFPMPRAGPAASLTRRSIVFPR